MSAQANGRLGLILSKGVVGSFVPIENPANRECSGMFQQLSDRHRFFYEYVLYIIQKVIVRKRTLVPWNSVLRFNLTDSLTARVHWIFGRAPTNKSRHGSALDEVAGQEFIERNLVRRFDRGLFPQRMFGRFGENPYPLLGQRSRFEMVAMLFRPASGVPEEVFAAGAHGRHDAGGWGALRLGQGLALFGQCRGIGLSRLAHVQ